MDTNINKVRSNNMDKQHQRGENYGPFNRNKNKNKNKKKYHNNKTININHYHIADNHGSISDARPKLESPTCRDRVDSLSDKIDGNQDTMHRYSFDKPLNVPNSSERYTPIFHVIRSSSGSPILSNENGPIPILRGSPVPNGNTKIQQPFFNQNEEDKLIQEIHNKKMEELKEKIPQEVKQEPKLVEILFDEPIKNIGDLIVLAKKYEIKPNEKYSIDLQKLKNIIPYLEELNQMVGMNDIKTRLAYQLMYFVQGFEFKHMLHTIIEGPPGVGKTCLGKILGNIYLELGCINQDGATGASEDEDDGNLLSLKKLLSVIANQEPKQQPKKNKFKIAKRSDLVGQYVGHTAIKTQKIINESFGGVLFIDEAYSLGGDDAFSKECINTINQNLSENGDKFICIIAGYSDALETNFFSHNSGLHRRFPFRYKIDKYSSSELTEILTNKLEKEKYSIDTGYQFKINKLLEDNKECFPNFGGDIETYFFHIKMMHSTRVFGKSIKLRNIFIKDDFISALDEMKTNNKKKDEKLTYFN